MSEARIILALLVEDDDEDAAIFCRHIGRLKGQKVDVVRASGEEEARSRLADEQFALAFIDLDLGGRGSGIDFLDRLHREKADVPAIVVTGSGDEIRAVAAMKLGAYDYVVKVNLSADLLERTIRNVRKRHSLEQERARMVEKLAALSVTDELTGLANRRHLIQELEEEVRRSERTSHLFALLVIDLDHFKWVNDRYGHQRGDEVLQHCSATLKQNVRKTDFVARYGGEEFCVILPVTAPEGARRVAEKLREAIRARPSPMPTISVGVAIWKPFSTVKDILRWADEALYRAKGTGRDSVVVYGDMARGASCEARGTDMEMGNE